MSIEHTAAAAALNQTRVLVVSAPGRAHELISCLEECGYQVRGVRQPADGPSVVQSWAPQAVVLDAANVVTPAEMVRLCQAARCVVVLIVEDYTSDEVARALTYGVDAITTKKALVGELGRALATGPSKYAAAADGRPKNATVAQLIGASPEMAKVWQLVTRAATIGTSVLITGETGVGKELVTRALHYLSPQRCGPFVAVNCAALPDTLLESELFGHEKGAFTGAAARHVGRFELADHGTLLLDEVGELSLPMQAKLLRVLQERVVERVGGSAPVPIDVRVVAATNRDLATEVERGAFRADLLYRLNALVIRVPPLRERKADVLPLWNFVVEQARAEAGRTESLATGSDAKRALLAYHWPGNVRELQNIARRTVALATGPTVALSDLPSELTQRALSPCRSLELSLAGYSLEELERAAILDTLAATANYEDAASMLGISVRKVYYRVKQFRAEQMRAEAEAASLATTADAPAQSRDAVRVVLAEDDDDVRLSLAEVLRARGYEVVEVANGADVLQHLRVDATPTSGSPPNVLVTDIQMPGLDGMHLLEGIRAMGMSIPVIVITAFSDDETLEQARRLGASAVLKKPLDLESLMHHLRDAQSTRRASERAVASSP